MLKSKEKSYSFAKVLQGEQNQKPSSWNKYEANSAKAAVARANFFLSITL
jgi:hypothetical protein